MARRQKITPRQPEENVDRLNNKGQEVLDDTPVTLPLRFQRGENIADRVRDLVEKELSRRAEHAGYESVDEANDFDVGDDYDPRSDHEVDEDAEAEYFRQRDERNSGWFKRAKKAPAEGGGKPDQTGEPPNESTKGGERPTGGSE